MPRAVSVSRFPIFGSFIPGGGEGGLCVNQAARPDSAERVRLAIKKRVSRDC